MSDSPALARLAVYSARRAALRADVLEAAADGATPMEIARASGLSRQWVAQILKTPTRAIERSLP